MRDIAGLTLLEVADLNALLKVGGGDVAARLISARPACASPAALPAGDAEDPGRGGDARGGCHPLALPSGSSGTGLSGEGT